MQAVILAAGLSSRFFPFAQHEHKSLLRIMGKPIITRTIEMLSSVGIKNIIIVVSDKNTFEEVIGDGKNLDVHITYVLHKGARGMGETLLECKEILAEKFLLLHPHHFEIREAIEQMLRKKISPSEGVLLIAQTAQASHFGIVKLENDRIVNVVEKPQQQNVGFRIVGAYLLPKAIIKTLSSVAAEHYSFETALARYAREHPFHYVKVNDKTLSLRYPWDILSLSDFLLDEMKSFKGKHVKISKTSTIEGEVYLSDKVTIAENAVIKGPCFLGENAYIGTNAIIRGGVIVEKDVVIGANMEVKHSVIMEGTKTHSGFIGDSVIGRSCRIAAFFCTGNVRLDRMPVSVAINDKNILTERKYLGAFIGNEVKIGIRVSTMPGVAIGDKAIIGPSTTVMHNVAPNVRYYTKMQEIVKKNMVKTASGVKDKVVLFDIDYTLFDTKLFKDSNLSTFSAYEEVIGVLQALGRDVTLGVFSEGDIDLQQTKLMRTALSTHFASDHIHIVAEKHKSLENILKKYEKQRLILVDDKLDILEKAKKIRSDVFTIWVRRGPFAEKAKPSVRFIPDAKVDNLHMALSFIAEI